ncbi:MAG: hypothetical protein MJY45_06645 [Bacteroidales bacterium]|nr:hypothetical protein [Bacteroidales bacterium]
MNQKAFDTRQRAETLLADAVSTWQRGNYSDQLEGLKNDPAFLLLVSAIAFQANELDNDIAHIENDVLEEFAELLIPYDAGHAVPTTVALSTMPSSEVGEVELDSSSVFTLTGTPYRFMPILHTRALGWQVESVVRKDGRKWEVKVALNSPMTDLSLATFALKKTDYRELRVSVNGEQLPLARPWEYSDLPLADCFSCMHAAYNKSRIFDPSMSVMELFAAYDIRMYCIKNHEPGRFVREDSMSIKFLFEFEGVAADFSISKSDIILNPLILANLSLNEVALDAANPIARLEAADGDGSGATPQIAHILAPDKDQIYSDAEIFVRKVCADRFNQASLLRLLASLMGKIHSDYYAFSRLNMAGCDTLMNELGLLLKKMMSMVSQAPGDNVSGTYVMLKNPDGNPDVSLKVRYLTTVGGALARDIDIRSSFSVPGGLDAKATVQIAEPQIGMDEIVSRQHIMDEVRYRIQTNDRIITPNDIRMFCYKELNRRYGITSKVVQDISVTQSLDTDTTLKGNACGYVILVTVSISGTPYVKRSICPQISKAEILLEKMMQLRSSNVYPIVVKIKIV